MSAWKTLREQILSYIECYQKELAAIDALGEMETIGSIYPNGYGRTVTITPVEGTNARDLALQIISRLRERGQTPTMATKTLDTSTGKITYKVPGPMAGWSAEISGGDPRCKVVAVKKTRIVPGKPAVAAVEAHEEEYTTYEIENPEECGAA